MNGAFEGNDVQPAREPLSVSQLNREVASVLEHGVPLLWVRGEVSNFVAAASGHWYFTLKDAQASVRSVMFRGRASQVGFTPRAGDRVEVRARVSLYEPRGDYQLQVQGMRRAGQGDLFEAFLRLKDKLAGEGLLDAERKRVPPAMPRAIGVVTSLHAAALRDVLSALARRAPHVPVVVYPAPVQGVDAAPRLVQALQQANRRQEVDVVLLVRGGGSIEDLWSFNDEALARAVCASALPVICGVGHESDFTIADFVADVRAPTPTAAAELACVPRNQAWQRVRQAASAMMLAQQRRLERLAQRLDRGAAQLLSPAQRLARQREQLLRLAQALRQTHAWQMGRAAQRLQAASAQLRALGPQQTLARGYAIVRDTEGRVVRSTDTLVAGSALAIDFERGRALATVDEIDPQASL